MSERRFDGRHVLITGAGTGIGREMARRFAQEGAALSLLARDVTRLEATVDAIRDECESEVGVHACDIRDADAIRAVLATACKARGPLFAVIANSGIGGSNEAGPKDRFEELVATNLVGTYNTLRAAEERFAEGPDRRHMVVVSSILARIGVPGYTGYCASKAGLLGLVRAFAMELAPANVQVNAVCPGWVDTEMAREGLRGMATGMGISFEEAHDRAMQDVPLGRMGKPEEVAGLIAWLCSVDAHGVTGQALDINGGAFMN
jgi:ketoreductase